MTSRDTEIERIAAVLDDLTRVEIEDDRGDVRVQRDYSEITAARLYDAGLHSQPASEPTLDVERRVELAREIGRLQAENDAVQALGRIVLAAGGEVRLPDNLLVKDVSVSTDFIKGMTIYRARLSQPADRAAARNVAFHDGAGTDQG